MNNEDYNSERKRYIKFAEVFFNGALNGLLNQIKDEKNKLALCYRGTYCNVYYNSHSIFKITKQNKKYLFEFNFNHARFSKEYKLIENKLESLCIDIVDYPSVSKKTGKTSSVRTARFFVQEDENDKQDWPEIIKIYKGLVNDFLNPILTYDYFKEREKKKSPQTEKKVQQALFSANFRNPEFFLYDLEYAQPRKSNASDTSGRFDMLGLKRIGEKWALILVELKSTESACTGKSGIEDHKKDHIRYLRHDVMKTRIDDAYEIIKINNLLFDTKFENIIIDPNKSDYLFILTGEAEKWYQKNKDNLGIENRVKLFVDDGPAADFKLP